MIRNLLCAGALLASAGSANAATIIFTAGGGGVAPGFDLVSDFNSAVAQGIVSGSSFVFQSVSNTLGALPAAGDGSTYLSVLANGIANIAFSDDVRAFSLDIGSVDAYNNVRINYADGGFELVTGSDFVAGPDGNQAADRTNGRFTVNGDGRLISGLQLASGRNSFEVDNLGASDVLAAVPEPASWAMMIAGFGLVGAGMRRRVAKVGYQTA